MHYHRPFTSLFAGVALAALASPAFALDGVDLVAKLNAANGASGLTVAYGTIATDGDTVTLKSTTVTPAGGEAMALGDVRLEGVAEDGDGARVDDARDREVASGFEHVARALHIHPLREPIVAHADLIPRSNVENAVDAFHRRTKARRVGDVADV